MLQVIPDSSLALDISSQKSNLVQVFPWEVFFHSESLFLYSIKVVTYAVGCGCGLNGGCNAARDGCDCNEGYIEVPFNLPLEKCQDKDECIASPCGEERECENTEGGYICVCVLGTWDGTQCCKYMPKNDSAALSIMSRIPSHLPYTCEKESS